MVYCGKPSKGCLACRSRKTRCDRQNPSCSQCIRAKRECPGYRNQLDLMFRNESEAVIGKATTHKTRKPKPSRTSTVTPRTRSRSQTPSQQPVHPPSRNDRSLDLFLSLHKIQTDVPGALTPSVEDRALSFYKNRSAIWLRNFDMVESMCSQNSTEDYLLASLSAVGLASYAASVRSPGLMRRARRDYGKALLLTNAALKSPVQYTNDSTLFAVMALGVFEAVAGNGEESLTAWGTHLEGASMLVKLRGPVQFMTDAGQRMFLQIASNLIFSSITNRRRMPEHIIALRKGSEPFVDVMDPGWRISSTIIMFTDLRATVMNEKNFDRRKVVEDALEMDRIFADIAANLPPYWQGKTVHDNTSPDAVWNGHYVVFNDFWVAQMMNTMRIFRIHVLEILREQIMAPDHHLIFSQEETAHLDEKTLRIMVLMQNEILTSIPQYAPWGVASYPSTSPIEPWHAYQVLWPLFLAANMDTTTREIGIWAMKRYEVMAEVGGIEHAAVFAKSMVKRLRLDMDDADPEKLSKPLKMDPFDWSFDGWAVAHGAILSAQINKPKSPQGSPKVKISAIPPGWKGGPPPGWTGGPPPGWTGGPPPGWTGGPPPGWKGGPPPGWQGGPPPGLSHESTSGTDTDSKAGAAMQKPAGWTGGPPPGWKGGPPPGWKGGPPPGLSHESASGTDTDPKAGAMQNLAGPPPGWKGGPPPGWKRGPPPGWKGGSQQDMATGSSLGLEGEQTASCVKPEIPVGWTGGPPPGWKGGPPPGWKGGPPPGWKDGSPSVNASSSSSNTDESQQGADLRAQIPPGWSGPPPPGWPEANATPPSSNPSTRRPSSNNVTDQTTTYPAPQPLANMARGPPAGWTGPPPPGWLEANTPISTTASSRSSSNATMTLPLNSRPSPGIGEVPSGIPPGWTGPPPPGWMEANIAGSNAPSRNASLASAHPSEGQNTPKMGPGGIPLNWTGPPPPGWKGSMPPGLGAGSSGTSQVTAGKGHQKRKSSGGGSRR